MKKYTSLVIVLLGITAGAFFALQYPGAGGKQIVPAESDVRVLKSGRVVFDVTLHSADEIHSLLNRAKQLAHKLPKGDDVPSIALVLHGPEIMYFAKENYEKHRELVDLASEMDKNKIIDIKVCRTKMRYLGLEEKDMPPYVEQVPYGPDEVKRLESKGYTVL
jgi:intracellular sulfur oxidation DsrE/DsrF family protein